MKSFLAYVFVFFAAFSGVTAQAKTIVVSDIDDTLKIAHVLDRMDALEYALQTGNIFGGMSTLFNEIQKNDPDIKFFYVSNAPAALMQEFHQEFIDVNKFPAGPVRLRSGFFQNDFKVTELHKIIQDEEPDDVILVGDNGERDSEIYEQIKIERPGVRFHTYIRRNYSGVLGSPLKSEQFEFVTAWDFLLHLRKDGFISDQQTQEFLPKFASAYLQEPEDQRYGNIIIPNWTDCRDFTWTAPDADLIVFYQHALVKMKIQSRCSQQPILEY